MVLAEDMISLVESLDKAWMLYKKGALTKGEFVAVKESILLRVLGVGNSYKENDEDRSMNQ